MAKKQAPTPPAADGGEKAGGKSKLKLIILIVLGLLLAVGLSVGGTWFILSKGDKSEEAKPAEAAAPAAPVRQPAIYQDLMPAFVVNFNYQNRTRYLQVSMALMSRDAAGMEKLKVHMPVLRNRLVMLLSGQDFAVLQTPLGKEMLLQQALASVQELAQKETGSTVVEQVLDQLGLNQLAMRPINSLSGGQLQKVIIARALAQSPSVLLLDEPISNLDLKNQIDVMQLVQGVTRAEKLAAVVTIHDLNMALRFGDKFLFLKDQKVQAITDRFGPSHMAFLVVPMVGAFFIDIVNALVIKLDRKSVV